MSWCCLKEARKSPPRAVQHGEKGGPKSSDAYHEYIKSLASILIWFRAILLRGSVLRRLRKPRTLRNCVNAHATLLYYPGRCSHGLLVTRDPLLDQPHLRF